MRAEARTPDGHGGGLPLDDYGLIGDCRTAALVSRHGSIDWCCLPRFDSGACFARLLDSERGGFFAIAAQSPGRGSQRYLEGTLVLETTISAGGGEARLLDFMPMPADEAGSSIVRIVEGVKGSVGLRISFAPRFDYGAVAPWIREEGGAFAAIGGDDGLLVHSEAGFEVVDHRLEAEMAVEEGERVRTAVAFRRPTELETGRQLGRLDRAAIDAALERTIGRWRGWVAAIDRERHGERVLRSALVLRALTFEPTGAIVAAPTTSLPATRDLDGARNWDYRYSWVRDSALAVRSLAELGQAKDADAFRRFIERSAAGHADDLQVVFGIGGERRMTEEDLELRGYREARPVRIGNGASLQLQLDAFGQIVDQSWRWHERGNSPDDDYWRFVADLVDAAAARWREPDRGIWEWRGEPRHFVHSKALAWSAVDYGIRLGEDCGRGVPRRWRAARDEMRRAIEAEGYDRRRGVFVQAFGHPDLDAALLRIPSVEFVDWEDERMLRTTDAIREQLGLDGLLRRYGSDDGMPEEGAFLPCSFWLATCLARQGRVAEGREAFRRALGAANPLGLFSEGYDPAPGRMLGNFPLGLTHLSHIEAALALEEAGA